MKYLAGLNGFKMRADLRSLSRNGDAHRVAPAGRVVEDRDRAKLAVDESVRPGLRRGDVRTPWVVDHFPNFPALDVEVKKRHGTAAIGEEVDVLADPDGVSVIGVLAGDLLHTRVRQIRQPHSGRLAAAVLLPGGLPLIERRIGEMSSVGGVARLESGRERESRRDSAGRRDGVELRQVPKTSAHGPDQDVLSIRSPAERLVFIGVIGQPQGFTAGGGHDVHVGVAVVGRRVGNLAAVRRKDRARAAPLPGHQELRVSALARHAPDFAAEVERDVCATESRVLQQERRAARSASVADTHGRREPADAQNRN